MRDRLVTDLQAIVGAEYCLSDASVAPYAIDGVQPQCVVFPADAAQIAEILSVVNAHQATVVPRGGGSHLVWGYPPERVDVVLSTQRLQAQLAYEPGDMTATVQAGVRLLDLQQTLARQGQFFALDPAALATTTVGGVVAANISGPRRLLYGTARDLVLGLSVVTMDGKRTKAGGRVVKNVTGYDLNKLYIGSFGTLAIIVELTVKLHPLPPSEATLGIGCAQQADLVTLLRAIMQLPLRLSSVALLNAASVNVIALQSGIALPDAAYTLVVRVEGTPAVTASQQQRLTAAVYRLAPSTVMQPWAAEEQERLWRGIEEFPYSMAAGMEHGVVSKVSLLMSDLPAFAHDIQVLATAQGNAWPLLAHAGNGIAYVAIPALAVGDSGEAAGAPLLQAVQALDTCVARWKGRRVIVRAPVAVKQQCQVWGAPGDDFALMRAIKATFDPHRRLNPGRFIGGL